MDKRQLLDMITPDMKLTKELFMKIYGYSIYDSSYKETALRKLESVGVSKARVYYKQFTTEYENHVQEEIKRAAAWYIDTLHRKRWFGIAKYRQGYAVYTDSLVKDNDFKELSTSAKILYLDMKRVASRTPIDEPFEYTNTYASQAIGISKPTFLTARNMLIAKGFIKEVYNGQKTYVGNKYIICKRKKKHSG